MKPYRPDLADIAESDFEADYNMLDVLEGGHDPVTETGTVPLLADDYTVELDYAILSQTTLTVTDITGGDVVLIPVPFELPPSTTQVAVLLERGLCKFNEALAGNSISVLYTPVGTSIQASWGNRLTKKIAAISDTVDPLTPVGASGTYYRSDGADPSWSAIQAADLPTGIDATKIGAGGVTSTEFGYIGTLTSDAQTQLNGKAATSHAHAATDITSGTLAIARGGTGLSAVGTALQVLRTNAGATAMEWADDSGFNAPQYTITVAKSGGDYTTVQAAIDAVPDGDTTNKWLIEIYPGVYDETVALDHPNVTLRGMGRDAVVIRHDNTSEEPMEFAIYVSAANCTLENLTADNPNSSDGGGAGDPPTVLSIGVSGGGVNATGFRAVNCTFTSLQKDTVFVWPDCDGAYFVNCRIKGTYDILSVQSAVYAIGCHFETNTAIAGVMWVGQTTGNLCAYNCTHEGDATNWLGMENGNAYVVGLSSSLEDEYAFEPPPIALWADGSGNTASTIFYADVVASSLQTGSTFGTTTATVIPRTGAKFEGNVDADTFTGAGPGITALNASNLGSGTVPDARFPATLPAISGANLTNLDAADVTGAGALPDSVLSSNVPLKNAANTFTAVNTFSGGVVRAVATKTAAYTITTADYLVRAEAGASDYTLTLPAAATCTGQELVIVCISAFDSVVTVKGNGAETMNGIAVSGGNEVYITPAGLLRIISNGTSWDILAAVGLV